MDPRSRLTVWQIIRELAAAGVTILLTTQYLDEADQLADRIAVLDQGRIVAEGTPEELKGRIPGGHVRLHFADPRSLREASILFPAAAITEDQLVLQVPANGTVDSLRELLNELYAANIDVARLSVHTADLDDVFLAVTGSTAAIPTNTCTRNSAAVMTTLGFTLSDSGVMLRRNLKHQLRYPSLTVMLIAMPIVFLLLFVYVFGGQLGAGLGPHDGRHAYLDYVLPGVLLITVGATVQGTAIMIASDMTGGIIDRFRTMAIARGVGPQRPRNRQPNPDHPGDRRSHRRRIRPRVPLQPRAATLASRDRDAAAVRVRADLAGSRARTSRQKRRDRFQHPDVPDAAAVARQRLRTDPNIAGRAAPVRRVPTIHTRR